MAAVRESGFILGVEMKMAGEITGMIVIMPAGIGEKRERRFGLS